MDSTSHVKCFAFCFALSSVERVPARRGRFLSVRPPTQSGRQQHKIFRCSLRRSERLVSNALLVTARVRGWVACVVMFRSSRVVAFVQTLFRTPEVAYENEAQ
jgi:hypothetical protein